MAVDTVSEAAFASMFLSLVETTPVKAYRDHGILCTTEQNGLHDVFILLN